MCRVIARLVDTSGDTLGYFTSESDTKVFTPEEITKRVSDGEIPEFKDKDIFTVNNSNIEVSEVIRADSVNVARLIRRLARLDRIRMDMNRHQHSASDHLFDYLEYCGWSVLDYVKKYLQNIQPYMIIRNKSQEPNENYVCVIDDMFARSNRFRVKSWRYVPVIAEEVKAYVPETNKRVITLWVMRGLVCKECTVTATQEGNYFLADYLAIEAQLVSVVNEYMYNIQENLKEKEFELDNEIYNKEVIYFTNSQQLSITSYGRDIVFTISLLIDHSLTSNNPDYRKFADGILSIYIGNLSLTDNERLRIYQVLQSRYQIQDSPRTQPLLQRVYNLLQASLGPHAVKNPATTEDLLIDVPSDVKDNWRKEMQAPPIGIDELGDKPSSKE